MAKAPTKRASLKGPPEISFQRGLNTLQMNKLLLQDGESAALVNADFKNFGEIGILWPNVNLYTGLTGRVHSLYRTDTDLFVGHGTILSHISTTTGTVTELVTGLTGKDLSMFATDTWLFMTDGTNHKKIWLLTLAVYAWGIDNPLTSPTGSVGATGLPTGTYDLYYTYVAVYPDGTEYETDLSPLGQVAVSLAKIEWTYPLTVPDSQITKIRLYRDKTGQTATLTQMTAAVEAKQAAMEVSTNLKIFSNMVQTALRRATNKQVVSNMASDQNTIVGPFEVGEVDVGSVGYSDNTSDEALVALVPFLRERYNPIFGA